MLRKTTAQRKIAALRKRVRVIQGGSSSSKTFSIIPMLITYAAENNGAEISVVSESIPHLRRGAIRDFLKIMDWTGNFSPERWNRSTLTYTFANGSFIEFFSGDQPDKMRGARRDVLFVNEANNVGWETYLQLSMRTRRFIYIDYNPTSEFWAHTELIGQPDTDFIILTYRDNEALEPAIVREIESARDKSAASEYWRNWWQVYGLGQVGSLQGVVFTDWKQIDRLPPEARREWVSIDFGFTNDPTAIVAGYRYNGQRIYHQLAYGTGMFNSDIAAALEGAGVSKSERIFADAAEPKSIAELVRMGWPVKASTKGADSIRHGIDIMQRSPFLVTAESLDLIKELRGYVWETDRSGKSLNVPKGGNDHAIDAARYGELSMEVKRTIRTRGWG